MTRISPAAQRNVDLQMRLLERSAEVHGAGNNDPIEWQSRPQHVAKERKIELVLSFESEKDRARLLHVLGATPRKKANGDLEVSWPPFKDELRLI